MAIPVVDLTSIHPQFIITYPKTHMHLRVRIVATVIFSNAPTTIEVNQGK